MNAVSLDDYRTVTPKGTVQFLRCLGERVRGRRFLHVNSTRYGGGVAEILNRLVPIMTDLGVDARWEVIKGDAAFFAVTKALHNALQGREELITKAMLNHYAEINRENARHLPLEGDLVLIHDPQPAPLINYRPAEGKWVWRCHIDLSHPQRQVWRHLRKYVAGYNAAVFSLPKFSQQIPIPQFLVYPSIDPLSDKNRELSTDEIDEMLARMDIPRDKPILLQVSRFDRFKDPVGVIKAYRLVKKHYDCHLILAGGTAQDDPEGQEVLAEVREEAGHDPDIHILELPPDAHLQINALQRAATIILQKSLREGFGLTVAEAMWKGKPVVGGASGGITVQVIDDVTGYTVNSIEGAAFRIRYLLNNPVLMARMGEAGREYVRREFLITRHVTDYLTILAFLTS
ncbi:Glycosyl transferase group 1 [Candidatus Methylomirabilis lanthanidiphila]|uniref:Glycosyl transferase group 1 n=1 Tax=Candidatus Methylomirabilis lanthanidiphila TaxID=2211376 RepID=A0A564ZEE6_9BACT|nr:glycosyltransferase [Candidatus Methylomirabilis lanthanidiphila]VUZ83695.1 Glycosyl transferase group 1 [Candidatus Methylomirabilis lanthanidiphila]